MSARRSVVRAAAVVIVAGGGLGIAAQPVHDATQAAAIAAVVPVPRVQLPPPARLPPPLGSQRRAALGRPAPARRLAIARARPGLARVYLGGAATRRVIALTFDDGDCPWCVARIIHTLARTGAHATIFPNGRYQTSWAPLAPLIRAMAARGALTIGDHTFFHRDALEESPSALRYDVSADEAWIERTFGVSARPFFRPPYGAYDRATLAIVGRLGFTKLIFWSGTVADSSLRTIPYILHAIRLYARPGAIILLHGNYRPTAQALPTILRLLRALRYKTVTLRELLG